MPPDYWGINSIRDLRFLGTAGLPPKTEAPHITLLDSFSSPDRMKEAKKIFTEVAATVKPFAITLSKLKYFTHAKRGFTLYVDPEIEPDENGKNPLQVLQEGLYKNFAHATWLEFKTTPAKFTPHVSLGKVASQEELDEVMRKYGETWVPIRFEVKELYLMSKLVHDTVVRFAIPLGRQTGERIPIFAENPFPSEGAYSLNINWIPSGTTESDVVSAFSRFNAISATVIYKNLGSDENYEKGWGNVVLPSKKERDEALLESFFIKGKKLEIFPCD